MISNQMRNLTIGLISLLSMGCILPNDATHFEKIPDEKWSDMWRDAWKKADEEQKKGADSSRYIKEWEKKYGRPWPYQRGEQQQDEQSNTNLIDGIDNNVWQENGGR